MFFLLFRPLNEVQMKGSDYYFLQLPTVNFYSNYSVPTVKIQSLWWFSYCFFVFRPKKNVKKMNSDRYFFSFRPLTFTQNNRFRPLKFEVWDCFPTVFFLFSDRKKNVNKNEFRPLFFQFPTVNFYSKKSVPTVKIRSLRLCSSCFFCFQTVK